MKPRVRYASTGLPIPAPRKGRVGLGDDDSGGDLESPGADEAASQDASLGPALDASATPETGSSSSSGGSSGGGSSSTSSMSSSTSTAPTSVAPASSNVWPWVVGGVAVAGAGYAVYHYSKKHHRR